MLIKPKASSSGRLPVFRNWIMNAAKIGVALEVLTIVGGYSVYHQMKNNPGMCDLTMKHFFPQFLTMIFHHSTCFSIPTAFANYMNQNFPLVIETSNKVMDFYDSINPFKETLEKWKADKKD